MRALALLTLFSLSCSAIVDKQATQCASDADCEKFGGFPSCTSGICMPSGLGPAGCFHGTPTTNGEFLNQCTLAESIPFDDCARLKFCGGALPALPGAR